MQQSECTHEAVMFWLPCNVSCSQLSTEHWPPTKQQSMVNIDIVIIMWLTCVSFWLLDLHRTLKVTACTHTVTKATHKRHASATSASWMIWILWNRWYILKLTASLGRGRVYCYYLIYLFVHNGNAAAAGLWTPYPADNNYYCTFVQHVISKNKSYKLILLLS
jgi:hypothetical protein